MTILTQTPPSEPYDDVVEEWDKLVDWLNGIVEKH